MAAIPLFFIVIVTFSVAVNAQLLAATGAVMAINSASIGGMLKIFTSSMAISPVKLEPRVPLKRICTVPLKPARLTVLFSHGSVLAVCCGPVIVVKDVQVVPPLLLASNSIVPVVAPCMWYQNSTPGEVKPVRLIQGETK